MGWGQNFQIFNIFFRGESSILRYISIWGREGSKNQEKIQRLLWLALLLTTPI